MIYVICLQMWNLLSPYMDNHHTFRFIDKIFANMDTFFQKNTETESETVTLRYLINIFEFT